MTTEYMQFVVPAACGLGGAALWQLLGALWSLTHSAGITVDQLYNDTAKAIRFHQGQLDSLAKHVAIGNVELDSLDERVGALERDGDVVIPTPYAYGGPVQRRK
jgi:hypothetical protein